MHSPPPPHLTDMLAFCCGLIIHEKTREDPYGLQSAFFSLSAMLPGNFEESEKRYMKDINKVDQTSNPSTQNKVLDVTKSTSPRGWKNTRRNNAKFV